MEEFFKLFIGKEVSQSSGEFQEDLTEEEYKIWEENKPKLVDSDLDVDKHRWYERSTDVYQVGDRFIGVNGATDMFSESMSWDDIGGDWVFFECTPVRITTYGKKT